VTDADCMNDPTKEKKLLTVVIVSHNSRRFLRRCLHSIFKSWSLPDFEVILVDNASSDGTVHMVRKSFSHVEVIANRENLGFSRACNQAVKSVSSRYILFLNPDIEVEPGAIAGMIRKMESSERTAIVGGLIFDASGIPQHGARRQIPGLLAAFFHLSGLWRLFPRSAWVNRYAQSHASPFEEREVGAVSGAFMMIRRDVFILVGGFDEDYFLYGEDMDLCLSVSARGFAVLYSPDARALHHHRTSTRKKPVRATYHFYRSMALFYRKHYRQGWRKFTVPLVSLACGGMFLIQLLFGERIRLTGGVMRIEKTWMKFVFVVLDLLSVTGSWFLAIYVRYGEFKALPPFTAPISCSW
jgi:GT2 family glycosyltransferase